MHASNPVWHPEYETGLWHSDENGVWENADFRCLHMCFWPRSSLDQESDKAGKFISRWNPREAPRQETGFRRIRRKFLPRYYDRRIDHKNRWYSNSSLQMFDDLGKFGRPDAFSSLNPKSDEGMERMKAISKQRINQDNRVHITSRSDRLN